jgi:hypothetical protein
LPTVQGPAEDADDGQHQHGGKRDEKIKNFHGEAQRASRNEFPTTSSELKAMPRPAAHGGR